MDRSTSALAGLLTWLPRASGDGPTFELEGADTTRAAPRERGWTLPGEALAPERIGCPARAGMDPTAACPACAG